MGKVISLFPDRASRIAPPSPAGAAGDAEDYFELGCAHETTSPRRARLAYQSALALDPRHAAAHTNLGRLDHEVGDLAAAETHYRRAVAAEPDEPTYRFNLGVVLEDGGRAAEAIAAYRACLALDPDFADAHFNLSGLLELAGDPLGAFRHLAAYRRLDRGSRAG